MTIEQVKALPWNTRLIYQMRTCYLKSAKCDDKGRVLVGTQKGYPLKGEKYRVHPVQLELPKALDNDRRR